MNIGISQRIIFHHRNYDCLEHGWYSLFKSHNIVPIPNRLDQNFKNLANNVDLFVISGGSETEVRRIVEIKLSTEMLLKEKPVLGICRGAFLLTILLGGEIEECENHLNCEHNVLVDEKIQVVNSFHSYRIKRLPPSATSIATDEQGHCEAWTDKGLSAIVWHPERMNEPIIPEKIKHMINLDN